MRLLKILLVPAALVIVPAASFAATPPSGAVPSEARDGINVTPAYHRGYWHHYSPYYYRPYYRPWRYYRPYYYRPYPRYRPYY
jgi:hypothetical protein